MERLAGSGWGAIAVFALGLLVYAIRAIAWPLNVGRDLDEYLYAWIQLFDSDVLLPWSMLFRTPGTPVARRRPARRRWRRARRAGARRAVRGLGRRLDRRRARSGRGRARDGGALLALPGLRRHVPRARERDRPSRPRSRSGRCSSSAASQHSVGRAFALVGLGIALLALIRPGNAVLLAFALYPLALPGTWRARATWAAAVAAAALLPLAAWSVHNGLRFDEWKVARGGNAVVPFYRAFLTDRIVSPEHGPASRRLGEAVREHLLTREPYRSYGVTSKEVFSAGSARVHEDMYTLSDEVFGWDTDYEGAPRRGGRGDPDQPWDYASGVLETVWLQLSEPYYRAVPGAPAPDADEPETVQVDGQTLPRPERGAAHSGGPEPLDPPSRQRDPRRLDVTDAASLRLRPRRRPAAVRPRAAPAGRALRRAAGPLREHAARGAAQPGLALVSAAGALARRRPRRARAETAVGRQDRPCALRCRTARGAAQRGRPAADRHFVLPVAPAFVLLGTVGLLQDAASRR